MLSDKKSEEYFKAKKIFPLLRTSKSDIFIVEGKTGNWEVRYDKLKCTWSCNCKNIRNSLCSHKKAVLLYIKKRNEEKNT